MEQDKEKVVIYVEKLCRTDMRLGRNVLHDSRSLMFPFNTAGLSIVDVTHERYISLFNQGNLGKCTGCAGCGAIHTAPFPNKENMVYPGTEAGSEKLYSDATKIDPYSGEYPPTDTGSNGLSIAKVLKDAGLISNYQWAFSLEEALKAGSKYSFITGTRWHEDMFTPDADGRVHPTGAIAGGHEYQLKSIDTKLGRVWFFNSWGDDWGVDGCFYLTWEDYAALLKEQGDVTILIPMADITPTPGYQFKTTLKMGSAGTEVIELQKVLTSTGDYAGKIDGKFGPLTRAAVRKYQARKGIASSGTETTTGWGQVGPKTRAALNAEAAPKKKSLEQALIEVESGGNDQAIGDLHLKDKAYGCLQVRKPVCTDVNKALGTKYAPEQCLGNRELSLTLYREYMRLYATEAQIGRSVTDEDRARIWNGGPTGWKRSTTVPYWTKVQRALAGQKVVPQSELRPKVANRS